jgi:hypothetical protein
MNSLLAIALICALIIVIIVPWDVWKMLLVLGTVFVVGSVGWFAFLIWLGGVQ